MAKKRGRGRPKKKTGHMTEQIHISVTGEKKAEYADAAESQGVTLSEWIRRVLDAAAGKVLGK